MQVRSDRDIAARGGAKKDKQLRKPEPKQPKLLIEPTAVPSFEPKILIEPEILPVRTSLDGLDFGHWEQGYGRKLTEVEKLEIVGSLSAFFSVLESEMHKYVENN